uniref:NADH-ubiquinone oxidoreductase chain 4 n=1 Tax=Urochela quadrinotata TaxID=1176167 RepID=L7P032_UROQU|nr:NADH dehydrogenase subunit 4 [Urochela quadrinotata]AFI54781.1 NADH dehydrogenase subunit 4 [Urochela quadrinotata]
MMKIFFFIIFLIPLIYNWLMVVISMMFLVMLFMMLNSFSYFSSHSFYFGMDMMSWGLMILTSWILFLMLLSSYKVLLKNSGKSEFLFNIIMLLLILVLVFMVNNMLLFYCFFEASLIPTLFLIYGWGYQPERLSAGFYLLFYTLFGSLPFLVGLFYIYNSSNTMLFWLIELELNGYIYLVMSLAFLFKMPMLFFHFWLPKAHVEAPISGSMILAGVLLKLGGYGLIRIFCFMYPQFWNNIIYLVIGVFSCMMVGMVCVMQVDIKSLIAYSSVAHMGMVISGIMSMNSFGILGSYILMIGHGLCSSCLFCLANIIYERSLSRSLSVNKGMLTVLPLFSLFMFMGCINNMSSPPTLNLLGEIMIILGNLSWSWLTFFFMSLGSFLSCVYSIYMYSSLNHGSLYSGLLSISNINCREYILLVLHLIPLNIAVLSVEFFVCFW